MKNSVILPNFLVWKFCGKTQYLHSFHTWKLGKITLFFAVKITGKNVLTIFKVTLLWVQNQIAYKFSELQAR